MRKASIFVILSFLSVTILHAEIVPVKKSTTLEAYLFTEFSYPVKRPSQPLLSQILSNKDYELFELALKKADDFKWERVNGIKSNINDDLAKEVIDWIRYYNGASDLNFANYRNYIKSNQHWPEIDQIHLRAESKISFRDDYNEIINFFIENEPKSGWGKIYLGNALLNSGKNSEGSELIKEGYINGQFSRSEQSQIIKNFKSIISQDDHKKRIDSLLWDGKYRTASRLIKYVNKDYQRLYEARIGLISFAGGVDELIKKVPAELKNDAGLVHDRIKWRVKKRKYDTALELLFDINKKNSDYLRRPDRFWKLKSFLIRKLIDQHEYKEAYNLAINHGLTESKDIAEAEWLAGWLSFSFLKEPETSFIHFSKIWDVSSRPISKARAAYWMGESLSEIGRVEDAEKWYEEASRYSLTFYGQIAATKLPVNKNFNPSLTIRKTLTAEKRDLYKDIFLAVSLLDEFDKTKLVKKFLRDLADREDKEISVYAMSLASDIGRNDFAVQTGKIYYYKNTELDPLSFPEVQRPNFGKIIFPKQSLIHSVIRQESQFDPKAGSYAGAKGLMQLMPYTAKRVSKGLRLDYAKSKLTNDPDYNVILGSAYLDKLLSNYNGSYILSLAAYNAGESRVSRWIKKYGDPRKDDISSENWIELIPFKETRNYVQRVMENIQVYEFIENNLNEIEYSIDSNLKRGYIGGKTIIKPTKKTEQS